MVSQFKFKCLVRFELASRFNISLRRFKFKAYGSCLLFRRQRIRKSKQLPKSNIFIYAAAMRILFFQILVGVFCLVELSFAESNCDIARAKLDEFFFKNSFGCKLDSDCDAFYYRETCRGPVVLPKVIATPEFEIRILEFKNKISMSRACSKEWKNSPACAPRAALPKCVAGQCRDLTVK